MRDKRFLSPELTSASCYSVTGNCILLQEEIYLEISQYIPAPLHSPLPPLFFIPFSITPLPAPHLFCLTHSKLPFTPPPPSPLPPLSPFFPSPSLPPPLPLSSSPSPSLLQTLWYGCTWGHCELGVWHESTVVWPLIVTPGLPELLTPTLTVCYTYAH